MPTFDDLYKAKVEAIFKRRCRLETRRPGEDWEDATDRIEAFVYSKASTSDAHQLAAGIYKVRDGATVIDVRFKLHNA